MSIENILRGAIGAHKGWARRRDIEEELKRELEAEEIGHQRDLALVGKRGEVEGEWRGGLLEREAELVRRVGLEQVPIRDLIALRRDLMGIEVEFEGLTPTEVGLAEAIDTRLNQLAGEKLPETVELLPEPVGVIGRGLDRITPWVRKGEFERKGFIPLAITERQERMEQERSAIRSLLSDIVPEEGWKAGIMKTLGIYEPEVEPAKKRSKRKNLFLEGEIDDAQLEKWWRDKR